MSSPSQNIQCPSCGFTCHLSSFDPAEGKATYVCERCREVIKINI